MALDRTSGFDMLVQISEDEINTQLATAFLAGTVLMPSMNIPINSSGLVGTAMINFNTPVADFDRPRPRMGLTIPFAGSQLQLTAPVSITVSPLSGTILVVDTIEMMTQSSSQIATMDFNTGTPDVSVDLSPSSTLLAPLLAAAGLNLVQVQNIMAGIVFQQLQSNIRRIDLSPPIPIVDDADPTTVFNIAVTTVNDTTATDRDCLTFGVQMANDSGGNINGVTTSFIPAGSNSLVMMSNFWLLARVMRPRVATAIGVAITDFDTPLRLNRNVPAPGGQGTLTNLEARVEGNRIRVDGRATDSGTGWSAVSNFTFFIDIALTAGAITVTATTPVVDTDVDLEWWVWLASLGLGGLFFGIVGVIVAAIVLAIVESVAEGIANNLVSTGIGGALSGIPSIPLGPIGGGLTMTGIVLDDLELRSTIIHSVSVPVKNQGTYSSVAGFTVDIDTGSIGTITLPGTDLTWNPVSGLTVNTPAGLSITGAPFGGLTPVQISRMPLSSRIIPVTLIPASFPPSLPFVTHHEIVFGLRTTEGRFAKARAWRSITEGLALKLDWVTYDTPVPQLDIAARWSIIERGEITEYVAPDCSMCKSSPVRWCGVFEARPRLLSFPIDYQWCLCGNVITEGGGQVPSRTGVLTYTLKENRLCIKSEMGKNVDCELCISAIDSRGQELFTCTQISQPGVEKKCRKCIPQRSNYTVEVLAIEPALNGWRPLLN